MYQACVGCPSACVMGLGRGAWGVRVGRQRVWQEGCGGGACAADPSCAGCFDTCDGSGQRGDGGCIAVRREREVCGW
jgi:hypothetical protein